MGPDEGVPHQVGVLHRHSVVGEGRHPRPLKGFRVGELLPFLAHGHRTDGEHMDPAGRRGLLQHIAHLLRAVGGRPGVGHGGDGGKSPRRRRRAAGGDGLLVFQAGLPQVDVHIHQPGAHHQTSGVNDLGLLVPQIAANDGHPAVLQQNVHDAADAPHRVHQAALTNQQLQWLAPFRMFLRRTVKKGTVPRPFHAHSTPCRRCWHS